MERGGGTQPWLRLFNFHVQNEILINAKVILSITSHHTAFLYILGRKNPNLTIITELGKEFFIFALLTNPGIFIKLNWKEFKEIDLLIGQETDRITTMLSN